MTNKYKKSSTLKKAEKGASKNFEKFRPIAKQIVANRWTDGAGGPKLDPDSAENRSLVNGITDALAVGSEIGKFGNMLTGAALAVGTIYIWSGIKDYKKSKEDLKELEQTLNEYREKLNSVSDEG